jgi:hypothetical protein
MKRAMFLAAGVLLCGGLAAQAETWQGAALVDNQCAAKVKADPDSHTRDCAIGCAKSGFGIVTADGTYLKFDAKGNDRALAALKASDKADHLRVDVTGDASGGVIKVKTLALK